MSKDGDANQKDTVSASDVDDESQPTEQVSMSMAVGQAAAKAMASAQVSDHAPWEQARTSITEASGTPNRRSETPSTPSHVVLDTQPLLGLSERPGQVPAKRYLHRKKLGRGGMAEVHLCGDRRVGRDVAVKMIHPRLSDKRPVQIQFVREARLQGQLEHPAVVPVYDLEVGDGSNAFFTMKRVRGSTLRDVLSAQRRLRRQTDSLNTELRSSAEEQRQLSVRKLLTAFGDICHAIEYAHTRRVAHLDLKPENIMMGDFGEVYVLDWGLAQSESEDEEGWRISAATLGYASPEQLELNNAEQGATSMTRLDVRSDIYALGAILFELLTLERLHNQGNADGIRASTVMGIEARPSVRCPDLQIPPEFDEICSRATALDPGKRYASVRELLDAVERYLDGDRDLEKRRVLAEKHAAKAGVVADRVLNDDDASEDDRRLAMNEVGRALAFDPSNQDARAVLLRLLTQPAKRIPAQAQAELDALGHRQEKIAAWSGAIGYVLWLALFIPFFIWSHVTNIVSVLLFVGGLAVSIGCLLINARRPIPTPALHYAALSASSFALAALARQFGPFLVLPGLIALNTLGYAVNRFGWERTVTLAIGLSAMLVPWLLEVFGVLSPSFAFESGKIIFTPNLHNFDMAPTLVFLATASSAVILTASYYFGHTMDAHKDAKKDLHLFSWQLRQLVPDAVEPMINDSMRAPARNDGTGSAPSQKKKD